MTKIPVLITDRLRLRGFTSRDAHRVAELCGDWDIAATTANIPHPYSLSMAEDWIAGHQKAYEGGEAATFAVTLIEDGRLIGAIGLHISKTNRLAEIGYWIGKPFWNSGYATEAAMAVIAYGFDQLGLNRIQARHMMKNPASGKVMEKVGMKLEGILRQSIFRWDTFEDAAIYSILRSEFAAGRKHPD